MHVDLSKLNAAQLDELIAAAAGRRATLQPEVRREAEALAQENVQVTAVLDPRFYVAETPIHGGVLFHVRHPGLGWLSFHLPHASTLQLIDLLQQWNRPEVSKH